MVNLCEKKNKSKNFVKPLKNSKNFVKLLIRQWKKYETIEKI